MTNERVTESIVRQHFEKFVNDSGLIIEEQRSSNGEINSLLSVSSKSKTGNPGRPEFIIRYEGHPDLVIVVECKANRQNHRSDSLSSPKEYALDGAVHYANHLSKSFDVIAIGISGTNKISISHFLVLRGQKISKEILGDQLLTPKDYLDAYYNEPAIFRQDYDALREYILKLNVKLHQCKVVESQRAILISSILIALDKKSFRQGYKFEDDPAELAQFVINSAIHQLKQAKVTDDGIRVIQSEFNFPINSPILSTKPGVLREIITDIDKEVNSFIRNHDYIDVLGQVYIEFLRYANSDKGLGIVLTPPHITDFFADVAQVNKNSIVYDNCTGTGGFLISAMKKMELDAKGDSKKIHQIKKKQIFGTEIQPSIYTLAVSNMYIHQDGKSNIKLASCFNIPNVVKELTEKIKPTIGFLNPPYTSDRNRDIVELDFVLNNLDCLQQGGICVSVIPMQSALNTNKRIAQIKEDILSRHTLEAVFSMPDELFFDSDVNVVTCIMVFSAKKAHPRNKEVFLGYFKDDGFVKRRIGGRIDALNKWDAIRKHWLDLFLNRRFCPGISVCVRLGHEDDWSPEAYMTTDYSTLVNEDFEDTMHQYSTYLFANRKRDTLHTNPISKGNLSLGDRDWEEFNLTDLFEITGSKTVLQRDLDLDPNASGDEYPYVTTSSANNGVADFYGKYSEDGNVLTVDSAVAGYCAYHHWGFSASDHVEKLIPKFNLTSLTAMFIVTIINRESYRYNYGRKCSQARLKQAKISLPACKEKNKPDFDFMETYVRQRKYSKNCLHYR